MRIIPVPLEHILGNNTEAGYGKRRWPFRPRRRVAELSHEYARQGLSPIMHVLKQSKKQSGLHPFRNAVLKGLGVILPPLLTIVFLLWVGNSVQRYIVQPVEWAARAVIVQQIATIYDLPPPGATMDETNPHKMVFEHQQFTQVQSGEWVPQKVYNRVRKDPGNLFPTTAQALYDRFVEVEYLRPRYTVPIFLSLLILLIYLLGKFMAARLGAMLWSQVEQLINRLPFIRTIYGTVKQVTDILFGDQEIEYTSVVAVEYPRKGIWSVGFVTGESMWALREAAGEPVLSVLMPTSPMPATGFTITVRKSETVELPISVDQAFQFIVSCGVVAPGAKVSPQAIRQAIENAVPKPSSPPVAHS